jgi:hypothetical protein
MLWMDSKQLLKRELPRESEADGENLLQYHIIWPGIEHGPLNWADVWARARPVLHKHSWIVQYDWLLLWPTIFRKLNLGFKKFFSQSLNRRWGANRIWNTVFEHSENIRHWHANFKISCRVLKCYARAYSKWHSAINILLLFHIWKNQWYAQHNKANRTC